MTRPLPILAFLPVLLLAGCRSTPAPVEAPSHRLRQIENMAANEETRLRADYQRVLAKLHSLEAVKEAEEAAYVENRTAPGTGVPAPPGFANAEAWRAHLQSERDALAKAINEIEAIQIRLAKRRRQAEADEAPIIPQLRIR